MSVLFDEKGIRDGRRRLPLLLLSLSDDILPSNIRLA
jgi:hypothetical protein